MKRMMMSTALLAALKAAQPAAVIGAPRMDAGNMAKLLADVKLELTRVGDEVKQTAEKGLAETKKFGDMTLELKDQSDKLLTDYHSLTSAQSKLEGIMEGLESRTLDVEQLIASGGAGGGQGERVTAGHEIANDERLKAYVEGGAQGSITLCPKNAITSADTSAGGIIWADRETEPVGMPRRQLVIRQLLNVATTESDVIRFTRQTMRTNAAAMTAEGGTMSESSYGWTKDQVTVGKVSHITHASDEALADAGQLMGLIDGEMRYGLDLEEENQILAGDGVGDNLTGLITDATTFSAAEGLPDATRIDRLRLGLLQIALANYAANGITIHPVDWAAIELLKDASGRFIFGDPNTLKTPMLWGLDTVPTLSLSVGEWMVGNFFMAATLYDRQAAEILISSEHGTNFVEGMKTVRGTKRLALANKRPAALVVGDFIFS